MSVTDDGRTPGPGESSATQVVDCVVQAIAALDRAGLVGEVNASVLLGSGSVTIDAKTKRRPLAPPRADLRQPPVASGPLAQNSGVATGWRWAPPRPDEVLAHPWWWRRMPGAQPHILVLEVWGPDDRVRERSSKAWLNNLGFSDDDPSAIEWAPCVPPPPGERAP